MVEGAEGWVCCVWVSAQGALLVPLGLEGGVRGFIVSEGGWESMCSAWRRAYLLHLRRLRMCVMEVANKACQVGVVRPTSCGVNAIRWMLWKNQPWWRLVCRMFPKCAYV